MEKTGMNQEDFVSKLMKNGFERAADSFSRMINNKVIGSNSKTKVISNKKDEDHLPKESGEVYVLTTSMIGQLSGKSYLILNLEECHEIYRSIFQNKKLDEAMLEAILLELDNIVSAAVISELVDVLQMEVFGDVPALKKIDAAKLKDYLATDYRKDEPTSMIVSTTTFVIGDRNKINPQFIWKLSPKIFEMIHEGLKTK